VKVRDLLDIPVFSQAKVIGGQNGLNRSVHSVNMMDAPDIIQFLQPDELLLTTAFGMKDNPEMLESLVCQMAQIGCAGLAVKTKRFLTEIPKGVSAAADRLALPIIELPLEHSLGEILHQSLSSILENHADQLKFALESHRKFSEILLEGKSFQEIIHALSSLLGYPVLLVDHKLEPLTQSSHFQRSPYRELLPRIKDTFSEQASAALPLFLCLTETSRLPFTNLCIHPILTDRPQGFLISFTDIEKQNLQLPLLALEQAANVIRFEMLKKQAVKERSRRYKNEFLSDVADGVVRTEQEILHRGKRYGLHENHPYLCIVAKKDPVKETDTTPVAANEEREFAEREMIYEQLKKQMIKRGSPFILFTKNDLFVSFLPTSTVKSDRQEQEKELAEFLRQTAEKLVGTHGVWLSFGIGNPVENVTTLSVAYKEALDALQTGYTGRKRNFVQFYRAKEVRDLLRMVPANDLAEFYRDTFQELLDLDEKERLELAKTLMTYYEHHCQVAETAKRLFVHRNTVIYRLEKIRQITGRELRSPGESLRFRLAFLMESVLGTLPPVREEQ
jgi:purine catabolism regulator